MESEIARPLNDAGAVRQIRRATGYVMGALDIAMTPEIRPRYGFLVYNASMHYWNVSWPLLLRESASRNAVPSMTMVVEALETVDDRDVEWRVRYLIIINLTNAHDGLEVPITSKKQYMLLDVDSDTGFVSLLTDEGETKEDAQLSRAQGDADEQAWDEVGAETVRRFEEGESLKLTLLSIMGKDLVVKCEQDPG